MSGPDRTRGRTPVRLKETKHKLPGALPAGEGVLWQGAPEWRAMARNALHLRALAIYFGLLCVWVGVSTALHGGSATEIAQDAGRAALAGSVPLLIGLLYAWLATRAAAYTITNRRVVIRMGLGVPLTLNLPYAQINGAALTMKSDGTGEIALELAPGQKGLGWIVLWPHARPWKFKNPQPMLRGLRDAEDAARILSRALAESANMPVLVAKPTGIVDTLDCQHNATPIAA